MSEPNDPEKKPFLYVVVCACGIAGDVGKLITAAQGQHWDVGIVATPQALAFLDTEAIEAQTGYPIRSAWRTPRTQSTSPSSEAQRHAAPQPTRPISVAPDTTALIRLGRTAWG